MRPQQLVSVYLNESASASSAPAPPGNVVSVWSEPLTDGPLTAGVFDNTPGTGCRMLGAGTIGTDKLGIFRLSGILVTTGIGGGAVTWVAFLPALSAVPVTHGSAMGIENPTGNLLPFDITVGVDGSVTLGGGNSLAAGSYQFSFTIACVLT